MSPRGGAAGDRPGGERVSADKPTPTVELGGERHPGGAERTREKVSTASPPLRLSKLIAPRAVLSGPQASKEALLASLASVVLKGASEAEISALHAAILDREASVNTYVGEGVAIPHARLDSVSGISLAVARHSEGFPYGVTTDQPVRIVVLVVGRDSLRDEHVRVLGAVARLLKAPERRARILEAPDAAAVRKLFDSGPGEARHKKSRPLSQLLLTYARRIGVELGVRSIIISVESKEELAILRRLPRRQGYIVASGSKDVIEAAERIVPHAILLPQVTLRRDSRVRLAALMAVQSGLIRKGDVVAFVSGAREAGLDTLTVLEVGREFGRFITAAGEFTKEVSPGVLERVITLATELAREGREGRPVGTIFVLGDPEKLAPHCQQMVMNPFRGYPEGERNILDPTLTETIKEFAAIDGAFVLRGDGVVTSAGTYLKAGRDVDLPGGYGSRHRAACAVTAECGCLAVALSQSTGEVTLFKSGAVVLSLPRVASMGGKG